jgi:hypothetical protein
MLFLVFFLITAAQKTLKIKISSYYKLTAEFFYQIIRQAWADSGTGFTGKATHCLTLAIQVSGQSSIGTNFVSYETFICVTQIEILLFGSCDPYSVLRPNPKFMLRDETR